MTEDEMTRAAKYERDKDDADEWETASQGTKEARRRLGAMISVRLSASELSQVREKAAEAGLSVSAFMRVAALQSHRAFGAPARTYTAAFQTDLPWAPNSGSSLANRVPRTSAPMSR